MSEGVSIGKDEEARVNRDLTRILRLLSRKTACGLEAGPEGGQIVFQYAGRPFGFSVQSVSRALSSHWVARTDEGYRITPEGCAALENRLGLSPANSVAESETPSSARKLQANPSESPLTRLYARKTRGVSYLSTQQFEAGERLRAAFEKGQLQPRLSASLEPGLAGISGRGNCSGATDISDFSMDARERVNQAIRFLGPDLSGVALDICCFLKGLERVERERQWPPRSAKLMLRTALSRLEEHYGLAQSGNGKRASTHFWGSDDYRPHMVGD